MLYRKLYFKGGSEMVVLLAFPGKCHYNRKHLQTIMSKKSKQVKITSLFGPGTNKSPKHSENISTDIIDDSSEVAECSSKGNGSL